MSRYFEVKDYTPPGGQEWSGPDYPGDGVYLTNSGIMFVRAGVVWNIPNDCLPLLTAGPSASADPGLDVHRLVDQFLDRIAPRRT